MNKLRQEQKRAINSVITLGMVTEHLEKLEEYIEDLPSKEFEHTKKYLGELKAAFSSEVNEDDYYE